MNAFPSKPLSDNRKSAIQNPKWLGLWVMALVLVAAVALAQGQQPEKIRRIGFLAVNSASADKHLDEAFKQSLRELGWVEGRNIAIEYRSAEGKPDRLPTLAAELVHAKVDVLVSGSPSAIRAARQATKTIPIVIVTNQDPVAVGYVESLARPGGNITGITNMTRELGGKRLELLRDVVPKLSRVGILWNARSAESGFGRGIQDYEAKAKALNIPLESLPIRPANLDFEGAFRSAAKARVSAVITLAHIVLSPYRREIAGLAINHRLPSMGEIEEYAEAGGLMSYAAEDDESYRRAAWYVDKILKGAKPGELPFEQPTKFELAINLKPPNKSD